jgi:CheY-like chemotaxis protein
MTRMLLAADEALPSMLQAALERESFKVVTGAAVKDALSRIAEEQFDLLLSDLLLPHAGDGFTFVSARCHTHLQAVTLLLSGSPSLEETLSAMRLRVNEIPCENDRNRLPPETYSVRRSFSPPASNLLPLESVASILEHDLDATIQYWMEMVNHDEELTCIPLSFEDRAGYLHNLMADLVNRLRLPAAEKARISLAAREHGDLRRKQGYTAAMVVEESRILEVSIFNTLQSNRRKVDFSNVLLDVVMIADEVDSQLKQAMFSYAEPRPGPIWAAA